MENQIENNSLDQTIINNQVSEDIIPKDNSFEPVKEMFNTPANEILMGKMDMAQFEQLGLLKPMIDATGLRANGNGAARRPTLSTNTFDPVLQQNPPNMNEPGGFQRMMEQKVKSAFENSEKNRAPGTGIASPTFSSMVQTNFKRYYEHPKFQSLGWKPYADNEAYYNANSTIYDDMSRMWGQFGSLVGTGFMSGYRSIGDLVSGGSMAMDLKSANEFEDAMAIGNSSRGGVLGFTNNLLLNSAYTVGIVSSIALEELALAGLEVATFGGATPLVAGRSVLNAARLAENIGKATTIGRMYSSGRTMMNTLKGIDTAKDFWAASKLGGKAVASIFAPETVAAVNRLHTTEVLAQNLNNMAKASEYAGSFYRDLRGLNLALSESKLEGGMVYNDMIKTGMDIQFAENNGGPVTPEQMEKIAGNAHKAAFQTTMHNMPAIFLTNKLVLGNSLGGFNKSLGRIFSESSVGIGNRLIKTGAKASPFIDAGTGLKGLATTIANAGVKGNLTKAGSAGLRYFASNLGEGIQETVQEAISAGTKNYYTTLLKDPLAGGSELYKASVTAGLGQQFTAQGFETFMSGFLMGGVVSGPQKLFFQGVPALYQKVVNPEKYNEYKQQKETYIKSVVDTYNAVWNAQAQDPNSIFDPKRFNFLQQKAAAEYKTLAAFAMDKFYFTDETDFAKFNQIHTVLSTGGAYLFQDQLNDYMKMSDQDLAEAFPSSKADVKNGKIRERLQSMINQIDQTEAIYEESKDRNPNPFTPEAYEKGTREWQQESIKKIAFEHARYLYMFTQDGFTRALERSNSIYQSLTSDPLFENMAANDLTVLLDERSIDTEVQMLINETDILSQDKANDAKVKEKTEKIKRLLSFKVILAENKNKDGSFDKRKINLLRKEFEKYVNYMAQSTGSFVKKEAIDDALKQIVDYTALKGRAKMYDKAIEYLNNPEKFNEVFERSAEIIQEEYKNRTKRFEEQVRNYTDVIERTQLANEIAKAGFTPDVDEMQMFLETGDTKYLETFYNQKGQILDSRDKEDLEEIKRLLNDYEQIRPDKKVEEDEIKDEEEVAEESRADIDDILVSAGITTEVSVKNSRLLDNAIKKAYDKYSAKETRAGKKPLSLENWIGSDAGKNLRAAFIAVKRIWVEDDLLINPNNPLTEEQIENESKLLAWLQSQEGKTNDEVQAVVNAVELTIEDITGQVESLPGQGEIIEGNKNNTVSEKGDVISLIQLNTVDPEGNVFTSYQLVDQYKQPLDEETLTRYSLPTLGIYDEVNKAEAIKMQKALNDSIPDSGKFSFAGATLNYGQLVYDKTGKEFIILSDPKQIKKDGKLLIIPSEDISPIIKETEKATQPITAKEFNESFSVQDLNVKLLPSNVARLSINEPIQPYPYRNKVEGSDEDDNNWAETSEQAIARYNLIMSLLTPEEVNNLELVVTLDSRGGELGPLLFIEGSKEANPYIQRVRAKYKIGIKISDPTVQAKVDAAIEKMGLTKSTSTNGVFGFMQNNNFVITNSQGTPIDPVNMTMDDYKNIIYLPEGMTKNPQADLELAQNNFALNNVLASSIPGLLAATKEVDGKIVAKYPNGIIPMSELPNGLSFVYKDGVMMYDKSPKSLAKLEFNSADKNGNYLIYQSELVRDENGKPVVPTQRTKIAISNLQDQAKRELVKEVEANLSETDLARLVSGEDAYNAVVLMPDGKYKLVNLKAGSLDSGGLNAMFVDLINQAQLTQKENKDGKESKYNDSFNDNINSKLFISAYPGLDFYLDVDKYGKIQLSIKADGKYTNIQLTKEEVNDNKLSANEKFELLIKRANESEVLKNAVSSPKTGSKVGMVLSPSNFRTSYARESSVEEIIEKTTTEVAPKVASNSKIELSGDSSAIQTARNMPVVTEGAFIPTEIVPAGIDEIVLDLETAGKRLDIEKRRKAELDELKRKRQFDKKNTDPINAKYDAELAALESEEVAITPEEKADAVNTDNINPEDINIDDIAALRNGVRLNKLEDVKQQLETLKAKLTEGLVGAAKIKAVKESKEYQDLLIERKKLESEANKIVSVEDSFLDVEDIDVFTQWALINLPDFISIQDIETLGNNLKAGGVRVGAFVLGLNNIGGGLTVNGTLFTGAKSPFKYHEAFHGVFRMLLTDAEIKKYLSIARKEVRAKLRAEGKSFESELQKFKNSADTYSEMSRERLEQEYYEEYLADEFEKFKTNPKQTQTDFAVKSLFTRLLEWIQSVFKSFTKNQLLTLFENIDAGKFKTASISSNQFVNSLMTGISLEANALIPYDTEQNANNKIGYYFLDSVIAEPLVSGIAAMYVQEIAKVKDPNVKRGDILDNVMNDFAALYDEDSESNQNLSDEQKKFLPQITEVFYNFSDELKSEVFKVLNIITKQTEEEEYNNEYFEEQVGLRNTEQYNMDASMIGGFGSLSEGLRSYLATTTIAETDYFGNKELKPGVKLIVPINFISAYNGLLKAVKNIDDPKKMLQNMYFFGLDNPQTGAVVTRLLQDFGLSVEELKAPGPLPTRVKNADLFQSVVKGFTTFRVDYLFVQRDNAGAVLIYSAAERDDINSQLDSWSQAWGQAEKKIKADPTFKEDTLSELDELFNKLIVIEKDGSKTKRKLKFSDEELSELSSKYSQNIFEFTGIKLSKQFIQFSIASAIENPNETQAALVNAYSEQTPMTANDLREIYLLIQQGADIFTEGKKGAKSRIKTLAIENAPFDETIGASVFKNPEGNLVYAHQLPTFHLKRIEELNDLAELQMLKDSDPYLENNFLLNSDAFMQMSKEKRQRILRIAGSSVGKINNTEEELNDKISGVSNKSTYGNYTPQEFTLSILNTYTALLNTTSNKVDYVEYFDNKLNRTVKSALAPVLLRVLEASNTGDLMYLPVIKAVKFENAGAGKVVLTDETIKIYVDSIENEYNRITKESINRLKRERNTEVIDDDIQLGYNTENGRGFKFTNTGLFITPDLKASLETIANRENAPSFEEALKELEISNKNFNSIVNQQLENQYDIFSKSLTDLKIQDQLSKSITQGLSVDAKASRDLIESAELLNLTYDKEYNLKQIFFNDWVNTIAINDILLGDQAVTLKDGVDAVKRAKMQNAAYYSAYSTIMAEDMGVMHTVDDISLVALEEPIGVSALTGKNIDRSDAQMWMTTKAFRYMWFGFGKLNPAQAKLIDKIEAGEKITSKEIFGQDGYVDMGSMLNSKKLVYGDGKTFIKMSAFVLTPELTSNKVKDENGNVTWVAKETRKELHDLRVKLEAIESLPGKQTLGIAAPLSALKMLKQKVQTLNRVGEDKPFEENDYTSLSARYMGLQVLTPSNKIEGIDPTQVKNIVTSEQNDDVFVEALNMNVGQIRAAYNLATSARVELKFKNKRNLIFSFDKGMQELAISRENNKLTPNLTAFLRYATEGLKASQASSNLLEFFSTQDGQQKYDLNNPITLNKFEQLFLSYLSKGVLAEKAPGHSVALVSDFGNKVYRRIFSVDENGIPDRSEVIRENVWNSLANKPDIVESTNIGGERSWLDIEIPKEGIVVLDRLRSGVKEYDKDGKFTGERYTEMLMPAHFKSVMDLIENSNGKFPEVLSKMFGVRIPSQDNHSTINIKHVDFLPAFYGSSAMFAQELIEISGADFDIDKVYMQIKDFYEKGGQFYEYGKQTTDQGKYTDYLRYISDKTKVSGTTYAEALELNQKGDQAATIENSVDTAEKEAVIKMADAVGIKKEDIENGIKALQLLGLPITKQQYLDYKKKFREPYEAPMNNAILDYKYALMGNTGVTETIIENETPISYTAASLKILTDLLKEFVGEGEVAGLLPGLSERSREDNIDINNMIGKIKAFTNNKGAAIGAIVLPNVYLSLLTEYGIKINPDGPQITINGITYNDFGVTREQLGKGLEGLRKQDIISALITMATDNAKERLVAKLGLNKHALGVVANLTALGVPIKTSLLLINNPMIQDIYSEALNKKDKLDPGVTQLTKKKILGLLVETNAIKEDQLKKELDELGIDFKSYGSITDEFLIDAFNNPNEVTAKEKIAMLTLFADAVKVKDFTSNMSAIAGLTNGLGKDISAVNEKALQVDKLFDEKAMMNLKPIYKSNTWQSKYLEIFNQIKNELLPVTFLTASENFQSILNEVYENVNTTSNDFNEEARAKVSKDLLSYLTIKAYQENKLKNDPQSVATLSNALIYPEGGYLSINDIVDRLRTTEAGKNNFFLDNFAINVKASDPKNQTGLNTVNANTFRSLNAGQKVDLQNSFAKLYGSLETKNDALSIINYIMVKDGLQLGYASLLEAISPFVMDAYLSQIETANVALRSNDDAKVKEAFGLNTEELKSDFVNNYLLSNISGPLLYTFNGNKPPEGIAIKKENTIVNEVKVDWNKVNGGTPMRFIRLKTLGVLGNTSYETFISISVPELTTQLYAKIETKGSNQQNAIGFMFGDRPTYEAVRKSIKVKNATTNQDAYAESVESGAPENFALSNVEMIQIGALNDEYADIEANEFGVNINGNNIANISAMEALLNAETKQQGTINIYAGTGENAELSNFAIRPFTISDFKYQSVEQAFQMLKAGYTKEKNDAESLSNNVIISKMAKTTSGAELKKLGKQIKGLDTAEWDNVSSDIMKELLLESFIQNPKALELLLATGNAELTHTQDNTKWGRIFPKLLMEVRSELSNSQPETTTTLADSMSDLERELYDEMNAEMQSDYSVIENFWDDNIQKNTEAKENLRVNNNVLSLEDLIDMYNNGIYPNQEEFIDQIKKCNL